MKLLDDLSNRIGSDASAGTEYIPGQNAQGGYGNDPYQNNQLDESDAYQSVNPAQIPSDDSAYQSPNVQGHQDEEFQRQQAAAAAQKPGRTPAEQEEHDRRVEAAKERIRKQTKSKFADAGKNKIGSEVNKRVGGKVGSEVGKEVAGKAAGSVGKAAGKEAAEVAAKTAAKAGAKVATKVGAEGALRAANVAIGTVSGPETLGLGWIASFLLEIALDLGLSEALDCLKSLKENNKAEALFHAQRAYMSVAMFLWLLIAITLCFSVVGAIVGIPLMFFFTLYMIAGLMFPKIGFFQGLSRWWEKAIVIFVDFIIIIILLAFLAGVLYWICQQSGLGTGFFATVGLKVTDWWNGTDFSGTITDACTQIGKF